MMNPISEGVISTETNNEACSFGGQELAVVNSAGSSQSAHRTSEEVARQLLMIDH